jgi:CubicO group peptidase (beta-lactamase class C family)
MQCTRVLLFTWTVLVAARPADAQGRPLAEHPKVVQAMELLRVWLDAQRDYDRLPGLSAAVVQDQQVVWSGGVGVTDLAKNTPATDQTIYSICSISKLFTSIAVMQQRDAGKLRLDDPATKFLPWLTIRQTAPDYGPATVEGMLTHASGLPRESDHPYWTGPDFPFPTRDQIVERIGKQETLYPAETHYQYSNLAMTLLGEIVAATSGRGYADYVTANILRPLGLTSTAPEMPDPAKEPRLARGYGSPTRQGTREPVAPFQVRGIAAAAGYSSTAQDLAAFAQWQFRVLGGKAGNGVLAMNTLREMQRIHWAEPDLQTTYGLGFSIWRNAGNTTFVGHGGSCPGYRSQLLLQPKDKVATVFLTNAMTNASTYARAMYDIMGPALIAAAKDTGAVKPVVASLAAYAGTYNDQPFGSESAVVPWEDGLAMLDLPTMNPAGDLTRLRKTGEHTFRRVRADGELMEPYVFTMGPDGKATSYTVHQNPYRRIR